MKKKLSKQTIFTILGILVILGSIPMAVLLVQQRQEIRKEAAACSPPNSRIDACHYCGANGYSGLDFSSGGEQDWCGCTLTYFGRTAEYVSRCGGGSPAVAPPPASGGQACGSWCQSQVGHSAPPWCRNDANPDPGYTLKGCTSSGISDNSYCCAFTQNVAAPPPTTQPPAASSPTTSCTPGQWNSSLCTRCLSNGQWPQGGIACPAGNLDFGSRNLDGDAGYTDQAHCDCQRRCWGADKMTVNCGGTVPIESVPGNENVSGSERGWGLYKTGVDCPAPAQQQVMPTPTPTTPLPPPTPTPTKPTVTPTVTPTLTPTPTMPLSCNEPCTTNSQCSGSLICSSGHCRKSDCVNEIDCTCPGPTPTPTVTPTITPTPTVTPTITPTPTTPVSCNQTCTTNSNCQGSLICSSGYCRNTNCTGETDCSCPGPTPTPTIPVSCNQSCTSNSNCQSGLICSNNYCRNTNCTGETDCSCPGPTPTPTPGPTSTPGPNATPTTTTVLAQVTPTPVVELPKAGFALPTFGFVLGGILLIITSLVFIL